MMTGLTTSDDERAAYLALALTPGIGWSRLAAMLAVFDSPSGALSAPFAFLCTVPGLSRPAATAVAAASIDTGHRAMAAAHRLGGRVLLPDDPDFPAALTPIPDPPAALFALGDTALCQRPAVAVVGSRNHSPYGAEACRIVALTAAGAGLAVVSGMARGLDAVAHETALDAGGATIGVLGNGLGVVYPAANRRLYERVAADGLLVTEHAPGERPHVGSFPRRNRLVSGLARATVVVEAAVGSGALITASTALDQGREVLAVPGPITCDTAGGVNRLVRDGAVPFLEPDDLLQFYPEAAPAAAPPPASLLPPDLAPDHRRVAEALLGGDAHIDVLARHLGQPVAQLLGTLLELEMAGVVVQRPGYVFGRA